MINLSFGDVRNKKIETPNHFVSHMIEHIAWRAGLSIDLTWENENWKDLGIALGKELRKFPTKTKQASTLGMIDDGSAITSVFIGKEGVKLSAAGGVDLKWFLGLRCEQVNSGAPLVELLEGIASGLSARIESTIWNVEDPHHTWEGIYRGLGIALNKIITPDDLKGQVASELLKDQNLEKCSLGGEITVLEKGANFAKVMRGTAETGITVAVNFLSPGGNKLNLEVDSSINLQVKEFDLLLNDFASALGAGIKIDFKAKAFSSSHVVMEDIGLVLGRALLEIIKVRMERYGVNGAGSNIQAPADIESERVQAGISVEGRKFWRFVSGDGNYAKMKSDLLIGQTVYKGLRSEDLDDFIDGLSGGMSASIMLHIKDCTAGPQETWISSFKALGKALNEAFQANPYRRGVPPGVKATLS